MPSRTGVRSMITVKYFSSRRVCRQMCSSTPITATFSNRPGSSIRTRLDHLHGSALGFRDLTHYIARSLLEAGGFSTRRHPQIG